MILQNVTVWMETVTQGQMAMESAIVSHHIQDLDVTLVRWVGFCHLFEMIYVLELQ